VLYLLMPRSDRVKGTYIAPIALFSKTFEPLCNRAKGHIERFPRPDNPANSGITWNFP
jgi:hypothetical protein